MTHNGLVPVDRKNGRNNLRQFFRDVIIHSGEIKHHYLSQAEVKKAGSEEEICEAPVIIFPFRLRGIDIKTSAFAEIPAFAVAFDVYPTRACVRTNDKDSVLNSGRKCTCFLNKISAGKTGSVSYQILQAKPKYLSVQVSPLSQ